MEHIHGMMYDQMTEDIMKEDGKQKKEHSGQDAHPSSPLPYTKPELEKIGTFQELTHVPKNPDPGDRPTRHMSGVL